jgi:hypothetical protein
MGYKTNHHHVQISLLLCKHRKVIHFGSFFASSLSICLQRRLWKHISQSFWKGFNETHFQNLQISTIVTTSVFFKKNSKNFVIFPTNFFGELLLFSYVN